MDLTTASVFESVAGDYAFTARQVGYWTGCAAGCDRCRDARLDDNADVPDDDDAWRVDRSCPMHSEHMAHAWQAHVAATYALSTVVGPFVRPTVL